MDLLEMQERFKNGVEDGQLTITGEMLESESASAIFETYFEDAELVVANVKFVDPSDDKFIIAGQVAPWGFSAQTTIEVSVDDGHGRLTFKIETPENWGFVDSFPALAATDFAELSLTQASLHFSSEEFIPDEASGQNACALWFQGEAEAQGILTRLKNLDNTIDTVKLVGSISSITPAIINLKVNRLPQLSFLSFNYNNAELCIYSKTPDPELDVPEEERPQYQPELVYSKCHLTGVLEFGKDVSLDCIALLSGVTTKVDFKGQAQPGIPLPNLEDLAPLFGATELISLLPEELRDLGSQLALTDVRAGYDSGSKQLALAEATIQTKQTFNLFPGLDVFRAEQLDFRWMVIRPLEDTRRCFYQISCRLGVGNSLQLDIGIREEDSGLWLFAKSVPGAPLNIKEIITLFIPALDFLPEMPINQFNFEGNQRDDFFRVYLEVEDDWPILPNGLLTLNEVQIEAVQQGGDSPSSTGMFSGGFSIAGRYFMVSTEPASEKPKGWLFKGKLVDSEIPIGELLKDIASIFNLEALVPGVLQGLVINDIAVELNTDTTAFKFDCGVALKAINADMEITLHISLDPVQEGHKFNLSGSLQVNYALFELAFDSAPGVEKFSGSWHQVDGEVVGINDLTGLLGLPELPIPAELDLGLEQASFVCDTQNSITVFNAESVNYGLANFVAFKHPITDKLQYFSGFAVGEINLSNLPLINQVFDDEKHRLAVEEINIAVASDDIDEDAVETVNELVEDGYPKVISGGLPAGVRLSMDLNLGGYVVPLSVDTSDGNNAAITLSEGADLLLASSEDTKPATEGETAADGTVWFSIQKKFGPVNFQSIGIRYRKGRIWIALKSALSTAGLTMELLDMSVGSTLDKFKPGFALDGIGMGYKNKTLGIEGTFLQIPGSDVEDGLEFAGGAVFKTRAFSLSAMGSYAETKENNNKLVSMFVFAQISRPFGGPPPFFVNGILAGFGYNSKLRIPTLDDLQELPLISGLEQPDKIGGDNASPMQALSKLRDGGWVSDSPGNIWLAAGIKFSTYQVFQSTALLIGQFGRDFSLSILGVSKGRFPKDETKTAYAYAEMDLVAHFSPDEGEITISAILSSSTYVLDKSCRVTGGFAMCFWFGDHEHAGDFVISLGGYSPFFQAPKWYPKLPRLGINWSVDSCVSIVGGGYMAITPSAAMAGGNLELSFEAGPLRAWFTANADIVIWWEPFYFIIDVGVRVGASLTISLFGHSKTLGVEMGCSLGLWGPATGGKVHVNWFIIAFTIKFGAKRCEGVENLSWDQFKEVLPAEADAVKITPIEGLAPAAATDDNEVEVDETPEKWLIRPYQLTFETQGALPSHELQLSADKTLEEGKKLDIRPMSKTGLSSFQRLNISRRHGSDEWQEMDLQDQDNPWSVEPNKQAVPNALWGTGTVSELSPGDDQLIKDQFVGFKVSAPKPQLGYSPGMVDKQEFAFFPLKNPPGENPLRADAAAEGAIASKKPGSTQEVAKVMDSQAQEKRASLLKGLSAVGHRKVEDGNVDKLAAKAQSGFRHDPLIIDRKQAA